MCTDQQHDEMFAHMTDIKKIYIKTLKSVKKAEFLWINITYLRVNKKDKNDDTAKLATKCMP